MADFAADSFGTDGAHDLIDELVDSTTPEELLVKCLMKVEKLPNLHDAGEACARAVAAAEVLALARGRGPTTWQVPAVVLELVRKYPFLIKDEECHRAAEQVKRIADDSELKDQMGWGDVGTKWADNMQDLVQRLQLV